MSISSSDASPQSASYVPSQELTPQTWVEVDLEALRRNFHRVADLLPESVSIIFSVKKDAYGHGLIPAVRALADAPRLYAVGVAVIQEALALRESGLNVPILSFSVLRGIALRAAIERDILLTVTTLGEASLADQAAASLGRMAAAHLKIDTGMGRIGLTPDDAARELREIARLRNLTIEGVYTHVPDGWSAPDKTRRQMEDLVRFADENGLSGRFLHLGGSDGLAAKSDPHLGGIRAGISIYGYHPGIAELEPAMHFKTRVIYRRRAPKNSRISYNGLRTLERDSELAVIGAGYGNGYPVALSNKASVLIRGRRFPVLGRVCMDQTVIDVTDCPEIALDDEVVLFGRQGMERLGADEAAAWANTIPYELLCMAGQINPRIYQPA